MLFAFWLLIAPQIEPLDFWLREFAEIGVVIFVTPKTTTTRSKWFWVDRLYKEDLSTSFFILLSEPVSLPIIEDSTWMGGYRGFCPRDVNFMAQPIRLGEVNVGTWLKVQQMEGNTSVVTTK